MIVLDTSVLISALTGSRQALPELRMTLNRGHRILIPSLVLFEWWRGPRTPGELATQEALFPSEQALAFGQREAVLAADLYRTVSRPRARAADIAIAACAIANHAALWTQNSRDFEDIPGLELYDLDRPTE
ncbi:MAG: type II toxin-antitoxin system VapC family toxin [Acidobacteriia bacterium]|nr:type II toxin-antitoxin system VapC family toxin [Terriglobia bacterium]MYG01158.1 type II toxin-antitoxin system VapC family toxin [Terriglobia bacterium]MYK09674.1 type II toxin-antitoxin system VapC family toxin [Terriglobia bacterium]